MRMGEGCSYACMSKGKAATTKDELPGKSWRPQTIIRLREIKVRIRVLVVLIFTSQDDGIFTSQGHWWRLRRTGRGKPDQEISSSTSEQHLAMDPQVIVPVLFFTSALIGAAAGLRFKVFALVPIAI